MLTCFDKVVAAHLDVTTELLTHVYETNEDTHRGTSFALDAQAISANVASNWFRTLTIASCIMSQTAFSYNGVWVYL